jgi:hypothetical protein
MEDAESTPFLWRQEEQRRTYPRFVVTVYQLILVWICGHPQNVKHRVCIVVHNYENTVLLYQSSCKRVLELLEFVLKCDIKW